MWIELGTFDNGSVLSWTYHDDGSAVTVVFLRSREYGFGVFVASPTSVKAPRGNQRDY